MVIIGHAKKAGAYGCRSVHPQQAQHHIDFLVEDRDVVTVWVRHVDNHAVVPTFVKGTVEEHVALIGDPDLFKEA